MQALENFEQVGSRAFYRPQGECTFDQVVELVATAMEHARGLGLTELLVSSRGLSGFPSPSTFMRYNFAVRWASCGGGVLRLAVVTRPEVVDHEKIGVVMAQNRGLETDVFTSEVDAIRWLDARAGRRR